MTLRSTATSIRGGISDDRAHSPLHREAHALQLFGVSFVKPDPTPRPDQVMDWFDAPPGLYLHVPFCRTLCPFCPYNKVPYRDDLAAAYMRRLEREVDAYRAASGGPFPSLYVGGGTPTLCLDSLAEILPRLVVTGERAIEVLPTHMSGDWPDRIADAGFDFVSLGVQSFDRRVLRRLRRPTSPETNRRAIEVAIGRFSCVDVDLIFDAGYDSPVSLLGDVRTCFEYGVDQVSTYPLMRFGYTPIGKGRHDRRKEHVLLGQASELAHAWGYERRSVWTFNRVGSPSYTSITRPFFLGLGAGAASYTGSAFLVDHFGVDLYMQAIDEGRLPIARLARLPKVAAAAYRTFWQAYTGRIPLDSGDPLLEHPLARAASQLARGCGWMRRTDDALVLTGSGYDRYHDLERWVTYHFIEPLWEEMMREHDRDARAIEFPGPASYSITQP